MTGLSIMFGDTPRLLKEAAPNLSRVALLIDPNDPISVGVISQHSNAAKALDRLRPVEVKALDAIDQAFSAIAQDGFNGASVTDAVQRTGAGRRVCIGKQVPTLSVTADMGHTDLEC